MSKGESRASERLRVAVRWSTVAAITVVGIVPLLGNELRVQDWDPQFARDIVERVHRFGGSFYENGIYNKGPLELVVYNVARHVGGYDGMWFVVSIFGAIAALITAFVAARAAQWRGAPAALALATGLALYIHLALSSSDYAGVLYARNMTVPLLAIAWAVTFEERFWRSDRARTLSCIVGGAALGLVVQTLVSEAFSAAAIGLALLWLLVHRTGAPARRKLVIVAIASSMVAFLSAPVWYALRGNFGEYWASWYGHARLMAVATRRSLGSQFALGWDQMYTYYQDRPLAFLAVATFLCFTYVTWSGATSRERAMNVSLLGWFAGSWLEQILSQRYSSHYFVINAVPTALMIAVLIGHAGRAASRNPRFARTMIALPLVAVVGTFYLSGANEFWDAVERTSEFRTFSTTAREEADGKSGTIHAVRGVLDLVSRDDDAILAWTNTPWPYLDLRRVAAGRFIWKSFLVGEIYLGGSGPEYILPNTWDWFREDVARSKPVAFVKTEKDPVPGTPFADLVKDQFRLVYSGAQPVYFRNDVAGEVLSGSATRPWVPLAGASARSGWDVSAGSAKYDDNSGRSSDVLPLASDSCFRIEGTANTEDGAPPAFDVRLEDNETKPDGEPEHETRHLKLEGDKASSGSDTVTYESISSGVQSSARGPVNFSLVVGRQAAVLVVNGEIRAATRVPTSVTVSLTSSRGSLAFSDLRTGPAPSASSC